MIRWLGVRDERMLEVHRRAKRWRKSGLMTAEAVELLGAMTPAWKGFGFVARVGFFLLGLLCVAALYGIQAVAEFGPRGVTTALVSIIVAELLIDRYGFLRTGIEEALWLGGLFAFIAGLPGPPRNEGLLLFAAASLIAGGRLRNAFFAAGSILFILVYAATEWDTSGAAWIALLAGAIAATASTRRLLRPVFDGALAWVTVAAPAMAVLLYYDSESEGILIGAIVTLPAMALVGVRGRAHPPLVGALVLGAFIVAESMRRTEWAVWTELLAWGLVAGAAAAVAEWKLRGRRLGLTSSPLLEDPESGLAELAATIAITPAKPVERESGLEPGGGEFGGGGASGQY